MITVKLDAEIKAVCPIHGVSIGRKDDKSTWRIDFADTATVEQREAARSALDAFNVEAAQLPTPQEKIERLERTEGQSVYVRGIREFMLGIADGLATINPQLSQQMLATPGMRKVKELDDKIKELRKQL